MLDRCVITRAPAGKGVWDPATGTYAPAVPVDVYAGACRVVAVNAAHRDVDAGDREVSISRWEVHLPVAGSEAVRAGDTVQVTAAVFDPAMVGRVFTVASPHAGSQMTARRLPVEAVV